MPRGTLPQASDTAYLGVDADDAVGYQWGMLRPHSHMSLMSLMSLMSMAVLGGLPSAARAQPEAAFAANPTLGCAIPHTVFFTDQTTERTGPSSEYAWFWEFGDGNTSTLQNPVHNYLTFGEFEVTLTATDANGMDTASTRIAVGGATPTPSFIATGATKGCGRLEVCFEDTTTSRDPLVARRWTFGDGSMSTDEAPCHTYEAAGAYDVSLAVQTACDDSPIHEIGMTDFVLVAPGPGESDAHCAEVSCDESGACAATTCDDGVRNGDETDVDCGGSCARCDEGDACEAATDCTSGVCAGDRCVPAACDDGVLNGDESDLDCGGSACGPCATGGACEVAADCASRVCAASACAAPSCEDGLMNGEEAEVDCGGDCAPCPDCRADTDCGSGAPRCDSGACVACTSDAHCLEGERCTTEGACTPDPTAARGGGGCSAAYAGGSPTGALLLVWILLALSVSARWGSRTKRNA